MERLRQRDLRALLAFVEELYAIRDSKAFATHLTAALPTVVPAEVTAYNEINRQRRRIEVVMHPADADFPGSMQIFTRHMGEHPLFAAYQQGQGSAVKISDFLTRSQFRHTGLYNEFFRRMGVGYQMAKGLPAPPSPLVPSAPLPPERVKTPAGPALRPASLPPESSRPSARSLIFRLSW